MRDIIYQRLQRFTEPGSMGLVQDVRFIRCYWPKLDKPTNLFAENSKGIEVLGSARNVVFPPDTVFLDYHPDALYPAELAVQTATPGRKMLNLTDEEALLWRAAYDKAVKSLSPTHAVHRTRNDCHFFRHEELVSLPGEKPIFESYVAPLSLSQVAELIEGTQSEDVLRADAVFVKIAVTFDAPDTQYFKVVDGRAVDVTDTLAEPQMVTNAEAVV